MCPVLEFRLPQERAEHGTEVDSPFFRLQLPSWKRQEARGNERKFLKAESKGTVFSFLCLPPVEHGARAAHVQLVEVGAGQTAAHPAFALNGGRAGLAAGLSGRRPRRAGAGNALRSRGHATMHSG